MANINRLNTLIAYLEEHVQPQRYVQQAWGCSGNLPKHFCGCALGWACMIPAFQEEGLSHQMNIPVYGDRYGCQAGEAFFDLSKTEARMIFGGCKRTLREEIDLLKEVVAKYSSAPQPVEVPDAQPFTL